MNTPIIDPATLSEEQREYIRILYDESSKAKMIHEREYYRLFTGYGNCQMAEEELGKIDQYKGELDVLEWLFGSDFFKKGE